MRYLALTIVASALSVGLFAGGYTPAGASGPLTVQSGQLAGLRYHVVKSGDTLSSIAQRYGVSRATIRSANGMPNDRIYLGARLLLENPDQGRTIPGLSSSSSSNSAKTSSTTHRVKEGETLGGIANRNSTTVAKLVKLNNLRSADLIRIGQKLQVESSTGSAQSSASGAVCPSKGTFQNDWGFPRAGGKRFHEGTDIFAPKGTPIVAMVSGRVTYDIGDSPGKHAVLIGDYGWQYYYAHMSKFANGGEATRVNAGDLIGYVGSTGSAAGGDTHLHLELRPVDGRPTNPYPLVLASCG